MKLARAITKSGDTFTLQPDGSYVKAVQVLEKAVQPPAVKSTTAYQAAMLSRLSEDWPITILSADAANRWSLRQLRARSRDLERNGGVANAYLNCLEADIIGSRGVRVHMTVREQEERTVTSPSEQKFLKALCAEALKFRTLSEPQRELYRREARKDPWKAAVLKATKKAEQLFEAKPDGSMVTPQGDFNRFANFTIEQEFAKFAKKGNCDVTGKHSLMDLCRLSVRTAARDGDALLLVYRGYPNRWGVAFQLIEGDYLDDYYNVEKLPNGNRIRMGVELNPYGRKVAYWIFAHHPGDYGVEGVNAYDPRRRRIAAIGEPPDPYFTDGRAEAVQAIHITKSKRSEETRGVPWITPAMQLIHHIESYKEAEITAAREEACKHIFYERDLLNSSGDEIAWEDVNGQVTDQFQPGGATELPPGVKVNFIDPKHPNQHMPDFLKAMKREVAMSVNYCYNILFGDLEGVNYSSLRGGLLTQREGSKMDQAWFSSDAFAPMFETWLEMSLLAGAIPRSLGDLETLCQYEARFRRWPWVDPKNDADTAVLLIQNKLTTRGRVIADMSGEDFEDTIDELDYEEGYIAQKTNLQPATPPAPAPPEGGKEPAKKEPDGDEEQGEDEETETPPNGKPVKSAFLGETALSELPEEVRSTVARFAQGHDDAKVLRYGMTVPELLNKADQHNLQTARHNLRNAGVKDSADEVRARTDKYILLLNDSIVDGHHFLAKAEKGKVTSSLPVLDLTPLRYQQPAMKGFDPGEPRAPDGKWGSGGGSPLAAAMKELEQSVEAPSEAEQSLASGFDAGDPKTWGDHATEEVHAHFPLYEKTDGERVSRNVHEWPEGEPETAAAQPLQDFLDDPESAEQWPLSESEAAEASELSAQLESGAGDKLSASDPDDVAEAVESHLHEEGQQRLGAIADRLQAAGVSDEERASLTAERDGLHGQAIDAGNAAHGELRQRYAALKKTAVANAKAKIAEHQQALNARISQAKKTVEGAMGKAEKHVDRIQERMEEYATDQEAIGVRKELLQLGHEPLPADHPQAARQKELMARDRELNPTHYAGGQKALHWRRRIR